MDNHKQMKADRFRTLKIYKKIKYSLRKNSLINKAQRKLTNKFIQGAITLYFRLIKSRFIINTNIRKHKFQKPYNLKNKIFIKLKNDYRSA